ncbi:MAG: PIN domain-containing protein [Bifidobacteriaceae bacterium]|nr:PIN domain-containing protein [Bifidobacteriaceae bacterium]
MLDANVLYPSTLRDVLIRVGQAGLARVRWTKDILDEVFRNLAANRPDLDTDRLAHTRRLMGLAIRDVEVTGYRRLIDQLELPDPDDRHVLAAAIRCHASLVVTKNLRDFPAAIISKHGVTATHPDQFLTAIVQENPAALTAICRDIAGSWRHDATTRDVLRSLATEAPRTVDLIRAANRAGLGPKVQ